ncbi:heme A synthase [Acidocella aquatica]|uniref:Heme A synthase n=1 Tax=Acidocella aquatica TaxID=1922313 RepID=A0ABQ6A5G1_9PROT|nr:COX15/CtaA family protein [Acidocella aquatica]GLR67690.1 heme A synthase [Acidocella aquatica]
MSKSSATIAAGQTNRVLISAWLYTVCFMIWVMVGIGGFTRETGSGLSIMNWDPIVGALPPMTADAWNKLFALYQTIPQAQILHKGMDLAGFQQLFWPEYIHRLWGRLIGVVFFLPLLGFILARRIEARLIPWLLLLFLMGGLQGAIGWFMVSSGFFAGSTAVEPWRLSLHFSAAMFLYVSVLWTALTVRHPTPTDPFEQRGLQRLTTLAILLLFCTMFAGTFVSGTHAISVFDPAKAIGVGMPPPGYPDTSFFTDQATILFNHQALATLTTLVLLITATKALRSNAGAPIRDAGLAIAGFVLLQFTLGVSALVSKMLDLGVAHQMNAVLLLTACILLLHRLRGATA